LVASIKWLERNKIFYYILGHQVPDYHTPATTRHESVSIIFPVCMYFCITNLCRRLDSVKQYFPVILTAVAKMKSALCTARTTYFLALKHAARSAEGLRASRAGSCRFSSSTRHHLSNAAAVESDDIAAAAARTGARDPRSIRNAAVIAHVDHGALQWTILPLFEMMFRRYGRVRI
jgi:hypothetical protein